MIAPPVLVELTRGTAPADAIVECRHRGALCLWRGDAPVLTLGDVETPVFPRSAVKSFQALPLVTTGAAARFGFGEAELSLAQASHDATDAHAASASSMLDRLGLSEADLACGAPFGQAERGALRHECSGKHAGMLAVARHLGAPTKGYERVDHPVQQAIAAAIEAVTGTAPASAPCGIDGCSVPTWALPLTALARGMAHLGRADDDPHAAACTALRAAVHAAPDMIWGQGRFDSEAARRFGPRLLAKRGAEGVYCAILAETDEAPSMGFAVKIEDGAPRAAKLVCAAVLSALLPGDDWLKAQALRPILTAAGVPVGEMGPASALSEALAAL